jgi:hypothetical protein
MSEECSIDKWNLFACNPNLPQFQNIEFLSGGAIVFPPPSLVLLLQGYCNGSSFRLSTLFSVSLHVPRSLHPIPHKLLTLVFGPMQPAFVITFHFLSAPIYTLVTFIPDNLSHYLFTHLYSKIPGPPHLPTNSHFLIADHLIRRWKLFDAHFVHTLPSR